jgi:hypothetical protein
MHFRCHPTVPILSGASIWPSNADAPRQTAELVAIDQHVALGFRTMIALTGLVLIYGALWKLSPNASLGVSWTGQFGDHSHNNTVKGYLSWRFLSSS